MSAAATSYGTPDRGLDIRRGGGLSPLREQFCTTYNLRPASGDTPEGYLPFVSRANLPSRGSHVDAALAWVATNTHPTYPPHPPDPGVGKEVVCVSVRISGYPSEQQLTTASLDWARHTVCCGPLDTQTRKHYCVKGLVGSPTRAPDLSSTPSKGWAPHTGRGCFSSVHLLRKGEGCKPRCGAPFLSSTIS